MKYLKLLFKKPLTKLALYTDVWTFDLKDIYESVNKRSTRNSETRTHKKKRTFLGSLFRHDQSASPQPEPMETEPIDYMQESSVRSRLASMSHDITRYCEFILQSIYENVKAMPTGVRWVCRTLSEMCKGKETEDTRNVMLGTFLFSKWWIPAIMRAEENGLLQDSSDTFRKNFPIVGNVLKKVFRCEFFDLPQYSALNSFIQAQIPNIKRYFQDLVQVDDLFQRPAASSPSHANPTPIAKYDADHVMTSYYQVAVGESRSRVAPHLLTSAQEMATFQEFRFQAVMLSLVEVKTLAEMVLAQEQAFRKVYLMNIVNFARKIREADESDHIFAQFPEEIRYEMFLEEKLPDGMESSYVARLHRSHTMLPKSDDFKQRRVLSKVKEALRNLLFALDSFAMFFESKEDSSLGQIVDFVLKFSYLFESRKSSIQDKVPLKILAQYLFTHLEQIPEDYRANNYRKLYMDLMSEYELRFNQKHQTASRNKQLLLTSINIMEKHVSDIRQEHKVQQTSQRTRRFLSLIAALEIPVCIHYDQIGNLTVVSQRDCPHTKLEYVGNFVMGAKRTSLPSKSSGARKSFKGGTQGHACSIEEFAEEFCKIENVKDCVKVEEDSCGIAAAFFSYLRFVGQVVASSHQSTPYREEDMEDTLEDIEQFICRKMYAEVFPSAATPQDQELCEVTRRLSWVSPDILDIPPLHRNEVMWSYAVKSLQEIDDFSSPSEKLTCLVDCITTIVNVLELCGPVGTAVSADDSLPIIIYVVIKAQPERMHSNLNYISRFRDQEKMMSKSGFCFSQIQSAIEFIEQVREHRLNLPEEEFTRRMQEGR